MQDSQRTFSRQSWFITHFTYSCYTYCMNNTEPFSPTEAFILGWEHRQCHSSLLCSTGSGNASSCSGHHTQTCSSLCTGHITSRSAWCAHSRRLSGCTVSQQFGIRYAAGMAQWGESQVGGISPTDLCHGFAKRQLCYMSSSTWTPDHYYNDRVIVLCV